MKAKAHPPPAESRAGLIGRALRETLVSLGYTHRAQKDVQLFCATWVDLSILARHLFRNKAHTAQRRNAKCRAPLLNGGTEMFSATAITEAQINEGVRLALDARRKLHRHIYGVDCACRLTPAGFDPETGEGVAIGCKCGAMENRDPATLLPFPEDTVMAEEASKGARLALDARRRFNRLVHGIDCSCRINTRDDQPAACSCGNATVGQC